MSTNQAGRGRIRRMITILTAGVSVAAAGVLTAPAAQADGPTGMDAVRAACAGRAGTAASLNEIWGRRGSMAFLRSAAMGRIVRGGIGAYSAVGAQAQAASAWEQVYIMRICDGRYIISQALNNTVWRAVQVPRTEVAFEGRHWAIWIQTVSRTITADSVFEAVINPGDAGTTGSITLYSVQRAGYVRAACNGVAANNMCVAHPAENQPLARGVFELRAWYSCARQGAPALVPGQAGCPLRPAPWVGG